MIKTNVMKILEQKKITYKHYEYDSTILDASKVADALGEDQNQVFKTLVTKGSSKYYVFMVPSNQTLDLKKCAKHLQEKSIDMIKQKELEPLTGYIHGGCSPIGMKKQLPTFIDESSKNFKTIIFSAGKRGHQIEISLDDLEKLTNVKILDIKKDE